MPPSKSLLRTMSPKRSRTLAPEDEDGSSLERKGSLRVRSNSLRGSLRLKHKTHGAPVSEDDESFKREWGMSREAEDELIKQFREQLKQAGILSPNTDWYFLRRFLRARQHDLKRAKEMYAATVKWRAEFGTDTIMEDFHFHERDAFISLYPQGYHKTDKMGRPIYVQHLGAINYKKMLDVTTEERMIRFHVQEYERCARIIMPACSVVAGRHIDQTFAIIDVKGVGLKHLTGEVKKMLSKIMAIDQNNYPEMLGHTCIINAPSIFKMIWVAIKGFIDPKTQEKIEVCQKDPTKALLEWVDADSLPEYLGGTSKATLLDDAGPWQDPKILAQVEAANARARKAGGGKHISEESGDESDGHSREGRNGLAAPKEAAAAKAGPADKDRFADIPPINMRRTGSMRSDITDAEDDAFYSPKSNASFTSDASFSSAADYMGRSPSEELEASPSGDLTREGSGALPQGSGADARLSVPIFARVRALEECIPGLEAKLHPHGIKDRGRAAASGSTTLVGRVEVLEEAIDALLRAQEAQLEGEKGKKKKKACSPCCSIM